MQFAQDRGTSFGRGPHRCAFGQVDHDEYGAVRGTLPDCAPTNSSCQKQEWRTFAHAPEWLHAAMALEGGGSPIAANCATEDAPHACAGFTYIIQLKYDLSAFKKLA